MTDAPEAQALVELIQTEFIGVDPDSQGVVLEDRDWNLIVAALATFAAGPVAYRWHWSNMPETFHYAGTFTGEAHPMQFVTPLYAPFPLTPEARL